MDEMNNTPVTNENEAHTVHSAPAPEMKFCPRCGKHLPASAVFCSGCGAHLTGDSASPSYAAAPVDESPLKTGDYFVMMLLFSLPLVGLIMMCVWAFSGNTNINRRNFSRANLIWYAIAAVLSVFLWSAILPLIGYAAGVVESELAYSYFSTICTRF